MLHEHEFDGNQTWVAKGHLFVIPVGKEKCPFSVLPLSQLLHFTTSHSLKAEAVCSHDSVLFLSVIWFVFGKRTVVTGCCPYSILG